MHVEQHIVGPMAVCCYLIGCEHSRQALVLDPGGEPDSIAARAQALGMRITTIINTHSHYDHVCGNARLKELTGAKLLIHSLEANGLIAPTITGEDPYYASCPPSPPADTVLDFQGEWQLPLGELSISVLHTPGHSPGSICLLAHGQLFSGDTIFVGDSGTTELPGGHRPTLGATIRQLMTTLPPATIIWPGHDIGPTPSSTISRERATNVNAVEYGYYLAPSEKVV